MILAEAESVEIGSGKVSIIDADIVVYGRNLVVLKIGNG
jgi:hypothetical protein